jgi:hypothetical protein
MDLGQASSVQTAQPRLIPAGKIRPVSRGAFIPAASGSKHVGRPKKGGFFVWMATTEYKNQIATDNPNER